MKVIHYFNTMIPGIENCFSRLTLPFPGSAAVCNSHAHSHTYGKILAIVILLADWMQ
jgi:hypothetical protein